MRRICAVTLVFLLLLLGTGCVNFQLLNVSELNARVMVHTPDASQPTTKLVRSGYIGETFSTHGGRFTVTVLPDEEFRALLDEMRTSITERLYSEGATLTAEDVTLLVTRLQEIDQAMEAMADDADSCGGAAPDFSTVTATISWDSNVGKWHVTCEIATAD